MRTGMQDRLKRAGDILVIWIAGMAWVGGWLVSKTTWVLGGPILQFIAWTALFFLLISVRRRGKAGSEIREALLQQRPDVARGWLEHIDAHPADDDPTTLSRAAVSRMAEGILESAMLAIFWGVLLGPAAALAAVCVHEIARYGRRSENPEDLLWYGALRMERWLSWPISWLAALFVYLVIPLGGGNRARTLAGYFNHWRSRPAARLGAALVMGLGIERIQTPDGIADPVKPEDIQRAVVVLWAATCLAAVLLSAFSCGVYLLT
jgi:cobalamin biosynthesis protein CobD/CbiB